VRSQYPLTVRDEDGTVPGDYFADLFIEAKLIVEIKACKARNDEHIAQVLGYLRASRIEHGLLINFGSGKFQIRKFVLSSGCDDALEMCRLLHAVRDFAIFSLPNDHTPASAFSWR
jgi:hypothetical protein